MSSISRRKFMRLAMTGAAGAFLAACAGQGNPLPQATARPGVDSAAEVQPVRGRIVRNTNRPDRNIRYYKPFVPPTPEEWRLIVSGLVATPLTLSFADTQQLPVVEQVSRMVCVEGWSWKAAWSGFEFGSLLEQVHPKVDAQFVRLTCPDDYWEVLSVEDLIRDRVLFAYRIDGSFLPDEYGSPLRLIVPWKYGYKGAKCITGMEFVSTLTPGYWSTVGPYSVDGDIQPGLDAPQDLGRIMRITEAGQEVTY